MSVGHYFETGAKVCVSYRSLRVAGLRGFPNQAEVLGYLPESYRIRTDDGELELIVPLEAVYGTCGCALPGYSGGCRAHIHHGPGHQSHTHCRLEGPHEFHEAVYGSERQFAEWQGDEVFSGFFDEPPEKNDD